MKQNRIIKIFGICSFLLIIVFLQTSCLNSNTTTTNGSISNNSLSEINGQTVDEDEVNDEEAIMVLEKKQKLISLKVKSENLAELENKRNEIENQIKSYLGDEIDNIGLSYYDINSGEKIIINGDDTFLAASTLKVQMNMVLSDMIQSGTVKENESLLYTEDCYEEGTGVLQFQDLSKPIDLSQLSDYSIIYSDNIATNMIIKRIGYYQMRKSIDSKLGHATDISGNYITANDETKLLELLYTNPNNNQLYLRLIENMKNTDFHDRLDLYLPHNLVAHKVGNYGSYVNDVGIIYTEKPYILSIYTNDIDNANEVIAHISKMIYDYQNTIQNLE